MRKLFVLTGFFCCTVFIYAQNIPGVAWSKRFGGDWHDIIEKIIPAGNSGWLVFGTTASTNGDIGTQLGGTDVWVTFWDKAGKIKWKKNLGSFSGDEFVDAIYENGVFYTLCSVLSPPYHNIYLVKMNLSGTILAQQTFGGSADDIPVKLLKCNDGFMILSKTTSTTLPLHHGGTDVYVIKFQDGGNTFNVQWDKCLGGSATDEVFGAELDNNGNALIVSETGSNNGDVTGCHGGSDIWIASLSSSGTINWQKCYGGSDNEFYGGVVKTTDQNLVVASRSASLNGDVTGLHYGGIAVPDAWIFKIDNSGNILWANCFGGTGNEVVYGITEKNNELFVAATTSGNSGNVTGYHGGVTDIWVFKLSSSGALLWQRCMGGTKTETFIQAGQAVIIRKTAIQMDMDGGCIALGYSTSLDGDVTSYHGTSGSTMQDTWLMKLSTDGVLKWQRCFGGTAMEQNGAVLQLNADNYLLGFSTASSDGDITGNSGGQDAWLARLGPVSYIKGSVYVDVNHNGTRDVGENLYPMPIRLESVKREDTTIVLTTTGLFSIDRDTGTYTTRVLPDFAFLASVPSSYTSNLLSHFTKDSINFGLQPTPGIHDLLVKMIPLGPARPGFPITFLVAYLNIGTEPLTNATLAFKKDNKLTFSGALPSNNSIDQDTVYWNLGTIQPFEGIKLILIDCAVKAPPLAHNGDLVKFISSIGFLETDLPPNNNSDTLRMILQGAFDPNDKTEAFAGKLPLANYMQGDELSYVIRFQNSGTDTAFNVVIRDTLDGNRVDYSTFKMIHASHPYSVQSEDGKVTWKFNNISLPDSNVNKVGSKGFIVFTVKPNSNLFAGDTIRNSASIYFDFNLPVKTNIVNTVLVPPVPIINSFTPTSGGNGTSITITGTNLTGATAVNFGGIAASSFTVNSATSITAVVGTGASGNVSVTTPGGTASIAGFAFIPPPTITSFGPSSGAIGTSITITGTNFTGATAVNFGGVSASSFTVNSATTITAVVGTGASGNVNVTTPGGTASMSGFTFIPIPTISSFTPASGVTGTTITITGTNFSGATAVSIGGVAASSFTVNSATSITAVVGTGTSGNVSVTTPGGIASMNGFTFIPAPTITSFTPASGGTGTSITITGTNFTGATAVSFGGVAASSFTVNSATTINALVGTGSSGNVSVTTSGGIASMSGFTFIPIPTITSFTPSSGGTGTSITITGNNFTGTTAVNFGGVAASSFTVNSATSITAVVGAGTSGNITVTTPGGTGSIAGFTFNTVTGINGPSNNNSIELRIFPNPTIDIAIIKHPSSNKNAQIRFVDVAGRTVKVFISVRNTTQSQLDLKILPSGLYNLVWSDGVRILSRTFMRK
jgi:hypothetical protein